MANQDKRHGRIFILGIIGFILILTLAGLVMPGPYRLGELTDVSFVALTDGQILTYDEVSGNWTNGYVNGTAVNMTLNQLSDVVLSSIQNNQIIQYNSTSLMWENRDPSSSDVYAVANLTDVSVVGLSDGQLLRYNGTSLLWENSAETTWSISTLTDVALNGLGDLQILQYNATSAKWENRAIPAQALAGLTDVSITSLSNNQILQYNSTSGKWENMNLQTWAISTLTDVSIIGLSNGQILIYNDTSAKWENQNQRAYAVSNLTDVTLLSLSDGQILKYNSTSGKWENRDVDTWAISTLTDVTIASLNNLQILQYNSTLGKWVNVAIPTQALSGLTDVSLASLINGNLLQYNSTSALWENEAPTVWAMSLLSDVNITSVMHGQMLQYDAVSSRWINVNAPNGTYVSANSPWYDEALVGYWQMNEGLGAYAYDDSENVNTGTISGASWVDGKYGKALDFNGIDNWVTLPSAVSRASDDFSILLWIKIHNVTQYKYAYAEGNTTSGTPFIVMGMGVTNGLWFSMRSDSNVVVSLLSGVPTADVWYHLTATRSGNLFSFYINAGTPATSTTVIGTTTVNTFNIGRFVKTTAGNYINATIDDVRIYNRALSTTEISTLYYGGLQSYAGQLWLNTTSDVLYVRNNNNSAWNFVASSIQGFGATTPSFPNSATDVQNTNPFPVRIYILTVGTTTAYNVTDTYGTMMNVATPLYAGMEITLDYLEKIRFTYTVAPTWKWYGAG